MTTFKLYLKCVSTNPEVKKLYINSVNKKNIKGDSGFDLYCPNSLSINCGEKELIDLEIKCKMVKIIEDVEYPCGYYLYPRSSIATKTPLHMANSVGIIDMGYRGNICGCVKYNMSRDEIGKIIQNPNINISYQIDKGTRLFQICSPNLDPFVVEMVDELDNTERGEGGFGSTGK